ncbi:hypothetical protein PAXRUDRAFT_302054 [Paxillus rubicundulus Ve08.2h10]|uniref:Uncharacterized protein n=1 Tax=Paxillus rubicundulus Ve08.2h10 TaxID=930991 RepID=A0A0D0DXF6_9AGAM|nr:hypothetical protein PAXRUDRAFT_302054 [Paxillus rubicundulus Ve08.2h10]
MNDEARGISLRTLWVLRGTRASRWIEGPGRGIRGDEAAGKHAAASCLEDMARGTKKPELTWVKVKPPHALERYLTFRGVVDEIPRKAFDTSLGCLSRYAEYASFCHLPSNGCWLRDARCQ